MAIPSLRNSKQLWHLADFLLALKDLMKRKDFSIKRMENDQTLYSGLDHKLPVI